MFNREDHRDSTEGSGPCGPRLAIWGLASGRSDLLVGVEKQQERLRLAEELGEWI